MLALAQNLSWDVVRKIGTCELQSWWVWLGQVPGADTIQ